MVANPSDAIRGGREEKHQPPETVTARRTSSRIRRRANRGRSVLDQIPEGGDETQGHTPSDADQSPYSSEGDEEQQQDVDGTGLVEENIKKEDNNKETISLSPGTTGKMRKWNELAKAQEALLESRKQPEASSTSNSGLHHR